MWANLVASLASVAIAAIFLLSAAFPAFRLGEPLVVLSAALLGASSLVGYAMAARARSWPVGYVVVAVLLSLIALILLLTGHTALFIAFWGSREAWRWFRAHRIAETRAARPPPGVLTIS